MKFERFDSRPVKPYHGNRVRDAGGTVAGGPARKIVFALMVLLAIAIAGGLAGCAGYSDSPELSPDQWAPPAVGSEWAPPPLMRMKGQETIPKPMMSATGGTAPYSLSALIDMALTQSPDTHAAWEAARVAAADYGKSKAPFYPNVLRR